MIVQQREVTAEEFWQIVQKSEDKQRLELIDGAIVEMPPSSPENTITAGRILAFVFNFVEERNLGYVSGADGGYTLSPNTVFVPDVAFVSKARVPTIPREFQGAPDLAIEVISPSETPRKINDKTARYLTSGAQMVWNVYPQDRIVEVWQSTEDGGMKVHTRTIHDILDGGDVLLDHHSKDHGLRTMGLSPLSIHNHHCGRPLPGFRLPINKIFPL